MSTILTNVANASVQVFTSSGTFTIPSGVNKVKVTVVGGGATYSVAGRSGGGGSSIGYITSIIPGRTLTVTVGSGGISPTGTPASGGTSSVSSGTQIISSISATGGSSMVIGYGMVGVGGIGSGGYLNLRGGQTGQSLFSSESDSLQTPGYGAAGVGINGGSGIVIFEW